jgi:hypothetical protein
MPRELKRRGCETTLSVRPDERGMNMNGIGRAGAGAASIWRRALHRFAVVFVPSGQPRLLRRVLDATMFGPPRLNDPFIWPSASAGHLALRELWCPCLIVATK